MRGRDSEARMERMAAAIVKRWRCCEASILLRFFGCWFVFFFFVLFFFFLVFWLIVGVGRWVLILISLNFSGSLVGFDDFTANWVGDDLA